MATDTPTFTDLLKTPVHLLAFGFGSGLAPKAPGTVGTLAAIPLYLLMTPLPLLAYVVVTLILSLAGIWLCGKTADDMGVHDHGGIVWDEFCGFLITMIAVPVTWYWVLIGFALFRLFDIWKPWPIRFFDKSVHGGWGIMVDDLIAGAMAWAVIQGLLLAGSGGF